MVSNKELYEKVFVQYLHKGYNEERADYIATRVVNKQRSHLRGQQELVSAGWAPGNMDLAPFMHDNPIELDTSEPERTIPSTWEERLMKYDAAEYMINHTDIIERALNDEGAETEAQEVRI